MENVESRDPYQVLMLKPAAPVADVRRLYRALAFKYHPDRARYVGIDPEYASERLKEIKWAYNQIRQQRPEDIGWEFLDYEFVKETSLLESAQGTFLEGFLKGFDKLMGESGIFGSKEVAVLDTFDAEVHRTHHNPDSRLDWMGYSKYYLAVNELDPEGPTQFPLEELLIYVSRSKGIPINPLYLKPLLDHYGLSGYLKDRMDIFVRRLSRAAKNRENAERRARGIIKSFGIDKILSKEIAPDDNTPPARFAAEHRLDFFKTELMCILNPFIRTKETESGELELSWIDSEYKSEKKITITKIDYEFLVYLVLGDKLLPYLGKESEAAKEFIPASLSYMKDAPTVVPSEVGNVSQKDYYQKLIEIAGARLPITASTELATVGTHEVLRNLATMYNQNPRLMQAMADIERGDKSGYEKIVRFLNKKERQKATPRLADILKAEDISNLWREMDDWHKLAFEMFSINDLPEFEPDDSGKMITPIYSIVSRRLANIINLKKKVGLNWSFEKEALGAYTSKLWVGRCSGIPYDNDVVAYASETIDLKFRQRKSKKSETPDITVRKVPNYSVSVHPLNKWDRKNVEKSVKKIIRSFKGKKLAINSSGMYIKTKTKDDAERIVDILRDGPESSLK